MQEHVIQEEMEGQKVGVCDACMCVCVLWADKLGGLREERWPGIPQTGCTAANSKLAQGVHLICCGRFEKNRKQLF